MEKIDLSEVECSSSTKLSSHYPSGSTKSSHYKSQAHGRAAHHHDASSFGNGRQNQVSNVLLFGVPIVALIMDGKERLCLAQISSTLLKDFSYNEIHNRRVALGINCIQCTPVQLEILRRAGAMPVTSRRCGMITKREAERLCQSFLGDHAPPQLPENFAFDVFHECAWGCRGSFVPSRYNSSRAKCIRCTFCQLFFSPNKFIFHSHRLPTSRYIQPDAANFNSWRRHLKLCSSTSNQNTNCGSSSSMDSKPEHMIGPSASANVINSGDSSNSTASNVISSSGILQNESSNPVVLASTPEIVHAWEDVKAMFNGGTRKRLLAVHSVPSSTASSSAGPKQEGHEKGAGKKNAHGSSNLHLKRNAAGSGSGNTFSSASRTSPLHFQQPKQSRQTPIYAHHDHAQNPQFPVNFNHHHQFALAAAAAASQSSFGGLAGNAQPETTRNTHAIWNPVNDDHNKSGVSGNSTLNEIINAAINSPQQQQQPPMHPTGISAVLANPFPWIHRNLINAPPPPIFPFSHPFGPSTYKYFGHESELGQVQGHNAGTGKNSAFKPIMPLTSDSAAPFELGRIGVSAPFPLPVHAANMEYHYLSTSSWLGAPGFSNKKCSVPIEGLGVPEDLSLNSAGGSVQQSSFSGSPSSSNTSSSYSPSEYKSNTAKDMKSTTALSPKEEQISPQPKLLSAKAKSTSKWIRAQNEESQSTSNGESSDVDITDNDEEDLGKCADNHCKYEKSDALSQSFVFLNQASQTHASQSQKKKPKLLSGGN